MNKVCGHVLAGTGHIRFWSMARTFTGLKLQGNIGKFGNQELSDVSGYADLPDGKVLIYPQDAIRSCAMLAAGFILLFYRHSAAPSLRKQSHMSASQTYLQWETLNLSRNASLGSMCIACSHLDCTSSSETTAWYSARLPAVFDHHACS